MLALSELFSPKKNSELFLLTFGSFQQRLPWMYSQNKKLSYCKETMRLLHNTEISALHYSNMAYFDQTEGIANKHIQTHHNLLVLSTEKLSSYKSDSL